MLPPEGVFVPTTVQEAKSAVASRVTGISFVPSTCMEVVPPLLVTDVIRGCAAIRTATADEVPFALALSVALAVKE